MHRLAQTLIVFFMCMVAYANGQIVPALPFQLQNNTVADATQVMANFNQILNNVNTNAAKNGSNSDITALLGLTTPLAPGVGGTTVFTGGTSTGSANAQVVATVVPSTFALAVGARVVFIAGFTNVPSATPLTLNVSGSGAKAVFRSTQAGVVTTAGGELIAGAVVEVVYDGTQFQIVAPMTVVGAMKDWAGLSGTMPPGWLRADGTCYTTAVYPALQATIGSWGAGCGGGTFNVPDTQGRVTAGVDLGANRLTGGGSGCAGSSITAACGLQNELILQTNFPNLNFPDTLGVTVTGGSISLSAAAGGVVNNQGVGGGANMTGGGGALNVGAITLSDSRSWGKTGTVTTGGSATPLTTVQPTLIVTKIIKY